MGLSDPCEASCCFPVCVARSSGVERPAAVKPRRVRVCTVARCLPWSLAHFQESFGSCLRGKAQLGPFVYARMTDSPPASANGGEALVSDLPGEALDSELQGDASLDQGSPRADFPPVDSVDRELSETCGSPHRDAEALSAGQCEHSPWLNPWDALSVDSGCRN